MSKSRVAVLIAAEANVSERTVRRYMGGRNVQPVVEQAIKAAAKKLGIKVQRQKAVRP